MLQNSELLKLKTHNDISKLKIAVFLDLKQSHLFVHVYTHTHAHTQPYEYFNSKDSTLFIVITTTPSIIILNIY